MWSSRSGRKSKKCQQCRIRRIKCDLRLPKCSQCLSVGHACSGPLAGRIFIIMDGHKSGGGRNKPMRGENALVPSSTGSSILQQPNLQLVPDASSRNNDPFSTYPVLPYSSEGVDGLVTFYLNVIGPKVISLNPRGTWFPSALADPVLFQSTLYSAALHFNSLWKKGDSQLAVFHRAHVLGMINERLRDPKHALSDQSIAAVALIVYTEVINGPMSEYSTHMNGLKQMIDMRGVLGRSDLRDLLQRMVASTSVFAAIRLNCIEPAPLGSPTQLEITSTCTFAARDFPIHTSLTEASSIILGRLRQHRFHPSILVVLNDLCQIISPFHHESTRPTTDYHQADLDAQLLYTEHRFVKYQSPKICAEDQVQRSFCVACLVFISLFLREMPGMVYLNEALTKRLWETMGNIDEISWAEAPQEFMLWMLFMGGLIARGRPERPWFVSGLSRLEPTPDFRNWQSVKVLLQSVLWIHKIPEVPCKALCDDVVALKISKGYSIASEAIHRPKE